MSECVVRTVRRQDGSQVAHLEEEIKACMDAGNTEIVLDMEETVYISSVTLRVILKAQKALLQKGGRLLIRHAGAPVMEVFDLVGFTGLLTFEDDAS